MTATLDEERDNIDRAISIIEKQRNVEKEKEEKEKEKLKFKYIEISDTYKELYCKICVNPLVDPLVHSLCGEMFCQKCISRSIKLSNKCPKCNGVIDEPSLTKPPKYVTNILDDIKVTCTVCNDSTIEIRRVEFQNHLDKQCKLKCKNQGCLQLLTKPDQLTHFEICEKEPTSCIARNSSCCYWVGPRDEKEQHESNCQLVKLEPILSIFSNRILKIEQENKEKDLIIKEMSNKIEQFEQDSKKKSKRSNNKSIIKQQQQNYIDEDEELEQDDDGIDKDTAISNVVQLVGKKEWTYNGEKIYYYNGENDDEVIPENIKSIALGPSKRTTHYICGNLPKSCTELFILDGFNQDILIGDLRVPSVKILHLFNLKCFIEAKSLHIPIEVLHLHDGFTYAKLEELIPLENLKELHLYNINSTGPILLNKHFPIYDGSNNKKPIVYTTVYLHDGFSHPICDLRITNIYKLFIGKITSKLENLENPTSTLKHIKHLVLLDGFNQVIKRSFFTNLETLEIVGDTKYPLNGSSIPKNTSTLIFNGNYSHVIESDVIPPSITLLRLGNLKHPLKSNFIPIGFQGKIVLESGFNQSSLSKLSTFKLLEIRNIESFQYGLITSNIENLYISNPQDNSIMLRYSNFTVLVEKFFQSMEPLISSLLAAKCINYQAEFTQDLSIGKIPNSITQLVFKNITGKLEPGCFGKNVKELCIVDCKHPLVPGILVGTIKKLYLFKLDCPLIVGSIGDGIETVYIGREFQHGLNIEKILPQSITNLNFQFDNPYVKIELKSGYQSIISKYPLVFPRNLKILTLNSILILNAHMEISFDKPFLHSDICQSLIVKNLYEIHCIGNIKFKGNMDRSHFPVLNKIFFYNFYNDIIIFPFNPNDQYFPTKYLTLYKYYENTVIKMIRDKKEEVISADIFK